MNYEVVLNNLKTEKTLLDTIKARRLEFFGRTKRHDPLIKKHILEGKVGAED